MLLLAAPAALLLPTRSRPPCMGLLDAGAAEPAAFFAAGLLVGGLSSQIIRPPGRPLERIWVRPGASKIGGVGLICIQDTPEGACICTCAAWRLKRRPQHVLLTVMLSRVSPVLRVQVIREMQRRCG